MCARLSYILLVLKNTWKRIRLDRQSLMRTPACAGRPCRQRLLTKQSGTNFGWHFFLWLQASVREVKYKLSCNVAFARRGALMCQASMQPRRARETSTPGPAPRGHHACGLAMVLCGCAVRLFDLGAGAGRARAVADTCHASTLRQRGHGPMALGAHCR